MRLIDADELEKKLQDVRQYYIENGMHGAEHILVYDFLRYVWEAPAIEAEPVRHGRWKVCENDPTYVRCSECGELNYEAYPSNYCPNCGARMEVEDATD